jgi:hypothetical protein
MIAHDKPTSLLLHHGITAVKRFVVLAPKDTIAMFVDILEYPVRYLLILSIGKEHWLQIYLPLSHFPLGCKAQDYYLAPLPQILGFIDVYLKAPFVYIILFGGKARSLP